MNYLSEETIRAVLVAAITAHGTRSAPAELIKETVDALIAADLVLRNANCQP